MHVLLFGTYDSQAHPRVAVLAEGLREAGIEVTECNFPLGLDTSARVAILRQPWRLPSLLVRLASRWMALTRAARRISTGRPIDAVVVGYLGHLDVHLARRLFPGVPLVVDHLVFAGDTARDRGETGSVKQLVLRTIDHRALATADVVVVDTQEHEREVPPRWRDKAVVVTVGAPRAWFETTPGHRASDDDPLRVVFFGLYTPLQGAPVIGEALARLVDVNIDVTMIGSGQDLEATRAAAAANPHVRWLDWVAPEDLPTTVAAHEVCLGVFGTSPKALRVVPNKVFQGAAAGCALVTSDTEPQRRALGDSAVFIPPGNPAALADALRALEADRAEVERRRKNCAELAIRDFTPERVVAPLITRLFGPPS